MQKIGTIIEACERFGVPTEILPDDIHSIPVYRNGRLRTALGKAFAGHPEYGRHIQIHKCVFVDPEQMRMTLAHEVAHIIAGIRSGHNEVWRVIAQSLGASGDRCVTAEHAASLGIERPERVVAHCDRCGVEVKRARALNRNRQFKHPGCGGAIVPHF